MSTSAGAHGEQATGEGAGAYKATGASLVAMILILTCFVSVMLLHSLRGDIDPIRRVMSEYANGSHGRVMSVVFYAFGLSALALGLRLRQGIVRRGATRAIPTLLVLAAVGMIVAGLFEVERPLVPDTIEEVIHSNASVVAFLLMITAMGLFSIACRDDPRWWTFRWTSTILTVTAAVTAMATPVTQTTGWSGAVQRLLAASILVWLLLTIFHVRGKAFSSA